MGLHNKIKIINLGEFNNKLLILNSFGAKYLLKKFFLSHSNQKGIGCTF